MRQALYARAEAFLEEFPFLRNHIQISRLVQRPIVQRMDLDLMDKHGWTSVWAFNRQRYGSSLKFILIGKDGRELSHANQATDYIESRTGWWKFLDLFVPKFMSTNGETVLEAIQKLPNQDDLGYVLELNDEHPWRENGLTVTLYKIPSGRSLSDWLVQIRELAANELKDELTKVDRV